MHLNTHSGRNVHTCPYCNIQFISRQSYESHVKVHTSGSSSISVSKYAEESKNKEQEKSNSGPQIVSVKSMQFDETHEEIQIEPDIIDDDIAAEDELTNTANKGGHQLPKMVSKPMIQIRPLSQMQPDIKESLSLDTIEAELAASKKPSVTYTCSFCNTKQSSQEQLIKHLNQHVNFGGNKPTPNDMETGYMSLKVQSPVQAGLWKTKYMCLSCGKMFGKDQQVKIHLNVHYGDNIYNCRFCEKVFANYSNFEVRIF